ncbi:uncharacterized protein KQ657_002901 [Scheffersomyces spartinae]|uniref:Uncharacterized protein n=1 Tax=Scheffersomyces spartinae TaxID=45513 RepID=A0A9P7V597_9ASCO|nr:uncharacterized protein KQ657_002901 [Scheffersomyces spartinae]KAG7191632.1 hypothetical protein KQ657_002901 [Scheffersomyces spartinae]
MNPTFYGYINSTTDALILIQNVLDNQFLLVRGRLQGKERACLIRSGNVFVFIEEQSGIKRWTDGISWSPSRINGQFLVYKERNKPRLKSFLSKELSSSPISADESSITSRTPNTDSISSSRSSISDPSGTKFASNENGGVGGNGKLVKKTLSLNYNNQTFHMISYYNPEDISTLPTPTSTLNNYINPALWIALKKTLSLGNKITLFDESYYIGASSKDTKGNSQQSQILNLVALNGLSQSNDYLQQQQQRQHPNYYPGNSVYTPVDPHQLPPLHTSHLDYTVNNLHQQQQQHPPRSNEGLNYHRSTSYPAPNPTPFYANGNTTAPLFNNYDNNYKQYSTTPFQQPQGTYQLNYSPFTTHTQQPQQMKQTFTPLLSNVPAQYDNNNSSNSINAITHGDYNQSSTLNNSYGSYSYQVRPTPNTASSCYQEPLQPPHTEMNPPNNGNPSVVVPVPMWYVEQQLAPLSQNIGDQMLEPIQ